MLEIILNLFFICFTRVTCGSYIDVMGEGSKCVVATFYIFRPDLTFLNGLSDFKTIDFTMMIVFCTAYDDRET